MCVYVLSSVGLFVAPWAITLQVPLSVGFPRQEYWSGLPFPSPGDLPNSGIKPASLVSPALAGGFFTISTTWEAPKFLQTCQIIQNNYIKKRRVAALIPLFKILLLMTIKTAQYY